VCTGSTCKPLGKKLAAAVAEYKKGLDPSSGPAVLHATSDLKAVVVGDDQVWSLKADKKLAFARPRLYARTREKPSMVGARVAGDLLIISWSACAGPCTKFALHDSTGRPIGSEGEAGAVIQLDPKRFVIVGEYTTVQVFELNGKARGVLAIPTDPDQAEPVRADENTLFIGYTKNDGMQVVKVSIYDDKALPPTIDKGMFLPKCSP
jgi:hypothetical protein